MVCSHWPEVSFLETDDGAVRIWKNYNCCEFYDKKEVVTAFQAVSDLQPLARSMYSSNR